MLNRFGSFSMNSTDLHACLSESQFQQILSFSPLYNINARRMFRSPTIWTDEKAEVERVREEKRTEEKRREEKRRSKKQEDQRREGARRKKTQVREKVDKSRSIVFFQWFVAPEGRKVGSLKWRVRSHLARWEVKNCTPLWRQAHFEVKTHKTHQRRSTLGSCDVEKCTPLWREAHVEGKSVKNWRSQTTFGTWDDEKVHAVVARSTFRSQQSKV